MQFDIKTCETLGRITGEAAMRFFSLPDTAEKFRRFAKEKVAELQEEIEAAMTAGDFPRVQVLQKRMEGFAAHLI